MPRKKHTKWQKVGKISLTVAQFLLDQLLALDEIFPRPFETPYQYRRRIDGWPPKCSPSRVRQELKRMKDRGWIIEAEKQGKKFLKLTEKGKLEGLCRKLQIIGNRPRSQWDGKWRIAIFDIPEKGRHARDTIRKTLKSAGFYQWQKSAYIYPYEIPSEVISYLKESGLLPFLRFARIDKIDDANDLQKYFRL